MVYMYIHVVVVSSLITYVHKTVISNATMTKRGTNQRNLKMKQKQTHLQRDIAVKFLHLSQQSGDEGGLPCPHLPHDGHQLTMLDVDVEAEDGG